MPQKPLRECKYPGCHELSRESYCEAHRKARQQRYDAQRLSPSQRGYGRDWQRIRQNALRRDFYLCVMCGAKASDVDHIVPLARGGSNALGNLQSLCHECHSRKTVTEDGGLGK